MDTVHLLESISVIATCISIILGVHAWRREYIGKRKIELAEDALTHFYQARDAVRRIRSPFGYSGEGKSRKSSEYERPEEKETLDRAYVVFERFEKERELFTGLEVMRYRFMARFGSDAGKPFDVLRSAINEIFGAANMLGGVYWQRQGRVQMSPQEFEKHLEQMQKFEAIFWEDYCKALGKDEDPINKAVNVAIAALEQICRPIIEEQSGVASFMVNPLKKLFSKD